MNEADLSLVDTIMDAINQQSNSRSLLFNTSFTQIAKSNLLILKGLLDYENKKGYFVVLDRPHQYMAYLLHMHDISQENIWYIDTVTHMSGTEKVESDNVDFVKGPFHIEHLFDAFEPDNEGGSHFASPDEIDFVLIDNISSMLNYNSIEKVEEFIESFHKLIQSRDNLMGCVTIDKESHAELYDMISKHFDNVIDIEELKNKR